MRRKPETEGTDGFGLVFERVSCKYPCIRFFLGLQALCSCPYLATELGACAKRYSSHSRPLLVQGLLDPLQDVIDLKDTTMVLPLKLSAAAFHGHGSCVKRDKGDPQVGVGVSIDLGRLDCGPIFWLWAKGALPATNHEMALVRMKTLQDSRRSRNN